MVPIKRKNNQMKGWELWSPLKTLNSLKSKCLAATWPFSIERMIFSSERLMQSACPDDERRNSKNLLGGE